MLYWMAAAKGHQEEATWQCPGNGSSPGKIPSRQQVNRSTLCFPGAAGLLVAFQQVLEVELICLEPGNPQKEGMGTGFLRVQKFFQVQITPADPWAGQTGVADGELQPLHQ